MSAAIGSLFSWVALLVRAQLAAWVADVSSEARRLVASLLWMAVLAIFGVLSVLMVAVTIVVTLWEQRVLAALLVSGLFASGAAIAAWRLRRLQCRND